MLLYRPTLQWKISNNNKCSLKSYSNNNNSNNNNSSNKLIFKDNNKLITFLDLSPR